MRSKRSRIVVAGVCAVPLLAAVGCGGGGGGGNDSAATTDGGAPIKIMVSAPREAPAYAAPEIFTNVRAAVAGINRRGGINGVRVQLLTCDNGHNPNRAAQCAQRAVREKVVAMVGNYTFLAAQGFYPTLEKNKVPSIGNGPGAPSDWTSPMSFPVSYSAQAYVAGPPVAMAREGCTRISTAGYDDPAYAPYFGFAHAGIEYAKVKSAGDVKFPATTTDFTASVRRAIGQGADCIFTLGPNQVVPPMVRGINNSGASLKLGGLTHIKDNIAGLGAALNGSPFVGPTPTPTANPADDAPEGLKLYAEDLKAIGQAKAVNMSDNGFDAWIGARFFYDLASSLPKGKVTSAALIKAGNTFHFTMPGVVGDSDFSKPAPLTSAPRIHNYVMYTKVVRNGKGVDTGGRVDLAPLFRTLN